MRCTTIIFLTICLLFAASPGYAYWIWTPKTQKWINPKTAVKPTPKEQFEVAKAAYDAKQYEDATREFKKLLKAYPKSFEAAESQYYLGLVAEAEDNLYGAYQAYQKVIDKYPFSERIPEIIEREYKIGEAFMEGKKRKSLGMALPVENPAIEIFSKVVENSNYGPFAPKAQYKLGLVLKGLMRYYEAEEAFNKVISAYPDSEWVGAAKFQIASCRASLSKSSDYDQEATREAKEKFEDFIREHPDAVLSRDAEENINHLREKEAESAYNIGRFYEKQKAWEAARIYYNEVVTNYSNSPWAAKAVERLQIIEKRKK
jgi:outer membrane protein assembly factor BamD